MFVIHPFLPRLIVTINLRIAHLRPFWQFPPPLFQSISFDVEDIICYPLVPVPCRIATPPSHPRIPPCTARAETSPDGGLRATICTAPSGHYLAEATLNTSIRKSSKPTAFVRTSSEIPNLPPTTSAAAPTDDFGVVTKSALVSLVQS